MSLGYLVLLLFLGGVGAGAVWLFKEEFPRKAFYLWIGAPMLLYDWRARRFSNPFLSDALETGSGG